MNEIARNVWHKEGHEIRTVEETVFEHGAPVMIPATPSPVPFVVKKVVCIQCGTPLNKILASRAPRGVKGVPPADLVEAG